MRRIAYVFAVCTCVFGALAPAHAGPKQVRLPAALRPVPPPPLPQPPEAPIRVFVIVLGCEWPQEWTFFPR